MCIRDRLKTDSAAAIAELKQLGIKKTVMLSGDRKASAEETAEKIGIDEVFAELLPAQKVEAVECLSLIHISQKGAGAGRRTRTRSAGTL